MCLHSPVLSDVGDDLRCDHVPVGSAVAEADVTNGSIPLCNVFARPTRIPS